MKSSGLTWSCSLVIDDVTYTITIIWKLPKDLQPSILAMKISDDKKFTAFFSTSSPLSNFHPSDFVDEKGVPFHCSEQKLHYEKALVKIFEDNDAANRILVASTPLECKQIEENILGFNQYKWDKVCEKIMFDACTAKFRQNPNLMSYLNDTKRSTLIEANPYDPKWGCDLGMKDKNLFNIQAWKGKNCLGLVLGRLCNNN